VFKTIPVRVIFIFDPCVLVSVGSSLLKSKLSCTAVCW